VITHAGRSLPLPAQLGDTDAFADHCSRLDLAVVSPPPGLYLESLATEHPDYPHRLNDQLLVEALPAGTAVLGWLPLHSPAAALAAIQHLVDNDLDGNDTASDRLVGFTMGTAHATALVDPAYDDVWRALAQAGLALQLHPDSDPYQPDAKGLANASVIGFPAATTAAVVKLLLDGEGFWTSGVRLCLVHGGGFLALVLPRLARAMPDRRQVVAERLATLYTDALVFGDPATHLVESTFSARHVLPGSDWPFPVGLSTDLPERQDWPAALAGWSPRAAALLPVTTSRKGMQHG
jgi:hypothetical protein